MDSKPSRRPSCSLTALIVSSLVAGPQGTGKGADGAKAALQGAWQAQSLEAEGNPAPDEAVKRMMFTFRGDKLLLRGNFRNDREEEATYSVDTGKSPKQLDFTVPGAPQPVLAIYDVNGDELKVCLRHASSKEGRPTEFASKPDSKLVLIVLKKQPK